MSQKKQKQKQTRKEKIQMLKAFIDKQKQSIIWRTDPYIHGTINGMIMAYGIVSDDEIEFLKLDEPIEPEVKQESKKLIITE